MVAPLQFDATGGDLWLVVGIFVLSTLSILLSVLIAALLVRGYRRGPGHTGMLALAIGLILLTTVPELLRFGLPTFTPVGTVGRSILVSGCELAGLGTILWAVYGGGS
jgi:hypothetical protein